MPNLMLSPTKNQGKLSALPKDLRSKSSMTNLFATKWPKSMGSGKLCLVRN